MLGSYVNPEHAIEDAWIIMHFACRINKWYEELVQIVHSRGGYVHLHSHGNISPVLPDFISIGIDIINPFDWEENPTLPPEPFGLMLRLHDFRLLSLERCVEMRCRCSDRLYGCQICGVASPSLTFIITTYHSAA